MCSMPVILHAFEWFVTKFPCYLISRLEVKWIACCLTVIMMHPKWTDRRHVYRWNNLNYDMLYHIHDFFNIVCVFFLHFLCDEINIRTPHLMLIVVSVSIFRFSAKTFSIGIRKVSYSFKHLIIVLSIRVGTGIMGWHQDRGVQA